MRSSCKVIMISDVSLEWELQPMHCRQCHAMAQESTLNLPHEWLDTVCSPSHEPCPILPIVIVIRYICFFNFRTHRNLLLIRGISVLVPCHIKGLVYLGFPTQREQLCRSNIAPRCVQGDCQHATTDPGPGAAKEHLLQPDGISGASEPFPRYCSETQIPRLYSGAALKTELWSQRLTSPTSAAFNTTLTQLCFPVCQFLAWSQVLELSDKSLKWWLQ